jgi:hypothetical protein
VVVNKEISSIWRVHAVVHFKPPPRAGRRYAFFKETGMRRTIGLTLALAFVGIGTAEAASLRGSPASMVQQNQVAKEHGLAFYRTGDEILAAVTRGELVELMGNENYAVADFVSFPYLQREVVVFVERLSAQYRQACGQKLVVTSAVRPSSGQPSNAHALSVHPAGMAVDLRVSDRVQCTDWLEATLLSLESRGVLNGIREFHPPHYHVAVFPEQYMAYVEEVLAAQAEAELAARAAAEAAANAAVAAVASAPVSAGFVAAGPTATEKRSESRRPLTAALAVLIALPIGLGVGVRRVLRKR